MGAAPRLALVSFALPRGLTLDEFDGIIDGLTALAARCRTTIGGGNLTRTPGPLTIDVTVLGTVKRRRALTRGGAKPGDVLYVSGTVGGAAAGLDMLRGRRPAEDAEGAKDAEGNVGNQSRTASVLSSMRSPSVLASASSATSASSSCIQRYLYPEPRLRLGTALSRNRAATACMDVSDGLADAVRQIAEASGVGAEIDAAALPIDAEAQRWFDEHGGNAVERALAADDYELLIASRPRAERVLRAAARHGGVPLTRIGTCTADRSLVLRQDGAGRPLPRGFTHFQ
jgi:thiamine-monophosphate kinase